MSHISLLRAALTVTLLGATATAAHAHNATVQTKLAELPQLAKADIAQWQTLPVRNVAPSVMAWWLDPKHNPEPKMFAVARENLNYNSGRSGKAGDTKASTSAFNILGPDVEAIIPVDARSELLIRATEEGVTQVKSIMQLLDRPLRQVEVESQFIEMDDASAKELGITFTDNEKLSLGFVRNAYRATINKLVAENKARILTAPRVTAINNLTARLGSSTSVPTVLGILDEKGQFQPLNELKSSGTSKLYLQTAFDFTVTPTINNDDTITLLLSPAKTLRLAVGTPDKEGETVLSDSLYVKQLAGVDSVVNVRDGDTIVLGGVPRNLMASDVPAGDAQADEGKKLLMFVTARIIRRMDETDQKIKIEKRDGIPVIVR